MWKVLIKRAVRDLGANKLRYLALSILIIFSIYMVVGMMGAAITVIEQTDVKDEELNVEDGQFTVFVPLSAYERAAITDTGVDLEEEFYLDFKANDEDIIRVFKVRENINLVSLIDGEMPVSDNEIVLERRYCEDNKINTGDTIIIGDQEFTVSGIGATPDYNNVLRKFSDSSVESSTFGVGFVTSESYINMRGSENSLASECYTYSYVLNDAMTDDELRDILEDNKYNVDDIDDVYFREYYSRMTSDRDELLDGVTELRDGASDLYDGVVELHDNAEPLAPMAPDLIAGIEELQDGAGELSDGMNEFYDETNDLIDEVFEIDNTNLTEFIRRADNSRIDAAADDVQINKNAGLAVGVLLMILFSYVISVFVVHSIDKESAVIGALYSLGVKKRDLMFSYIMLPVLVAFLSGVAGTLIGLFTPLGIEAEMADALGYYSMPLIDVIISPWLIVYGVVLPPVISIVVNVLVISSRLKRTPLSLLRSEQKAAKGRELNFKKMKFMNLFRIRQMLREMRIGLTVVFGLFISLIVAMLAVNIYMYCVRYNTLSVQNTNFEYMYLYKYPEEEVPEGGYEAIVQTCNKEFMSYTFDVELVGIREDEPFFGIDNMPSSKGEAAISSSFAYKYKIAIGDVFTINDKENDTIYAFRVTDIVDYSASMMVYLNIDDMRELYGMDDEYYNAVFSDHDLNVETGRLYSVLSKDDIRRSSEVFFNQMRSLIYTLAVASAVIFAMVMYLMMKTMVDRSAFNISIVKVFGYRNNEVRKMYLDGNFYIVALGALLSIPLTKLIMNLVYPSYLVGNVGVGISQAFPWYVYVGMYAAILVLYFIINNVLIFRIRKVTPAEVLKNRE
ncbi:MAG: ABC transporter permease [Clostridiales bacterium]|nr:ABC transporter permease [Clostridiales bacterium]